MGKVIAICGIDGSGKTTQIRLVCNCLRKNGVKCKYVWFRWTAILSYPFLALCRLLGYTSWRTIDRSNTKYAEHRFYMNRTLTRIWPWLFTVDTLIHSILDIKIQAILGYGILCDRFIPDILIDLMCETRNYRIPTHLIGRLLLSLIPNNSKVIVLDAPEDIAYSRKFDIPDIKYLKERRKLYLELAKSLNISVVNGTEKINRVNMAILRAVLDNGNAN